MMISRIFFHPACRNLLLAMLFISQISACDHEYENMKVNYPVGSFPESVTAFQSANSEYDDLNSGPPPMLHMYFPFYFSSNRSTQGGTFDIESMEVHAIFDQNSGHFSMEGSFPGPAWPGNNSPSNEYGPFTAPLADGGTMYMYASDVNGGLDIYHVVDDGAVNASSALNSISDDAYPTFGPDDSVYLSSSRGGDFDIYQAAVPEGADLPTWLAGAGNAVVTKAEALNTADNDKCPYINGKLLVFTSDRPGGHGGYDLYYSEYGTDGWSAPANFGPSINSAYDEYRPAVVYAPDYSNDLMIFSSNRPGGKGGFDLYYIGIPKKTGQ